MSDTHDDDLLARLLTDQLPPVPPEVADPPPAGTLIRRVRTRRLALACSAAAVVAVLGASAVALGVQHRPTVNAATREGVEHVAIKDPTATGDWTEGQAQPVTGVEIGTDDRTLGVSFTAGVCTNVKFTVVEFDDRVTVRLATLTDLRRCPAVAIAGTLRVRLDRSLGDRPVFDAVTGRPVDVWHRSELRRLTYLPPGCVVSRSAPQPDWAVYANGGGYTVRTRQVLPGRALPGQGAAPPDEGTTEPIRTGTVHGQPAAVVLNTVSPKLDPATRRPYTDPATHRPYEPVRRVMVSWSEAGWAFTVSVTPQQGHPYDRDALVEQALRVADGLR